MRTAVYVLGGPSEGPLSTVGRRNDTIQRVFTPACFSEGCRELALDGAVRGHRGRAFE